MDNQPGPDISLDSIEDWIVKYRAALAQDLKRSQSRSKRFRSAIEDFVRQHFNLNALPDIHFIPTRLTKLRPGKNPSSPDLARLG
jgi:hypothetical protein